MEFILTGGREAIAKTTPKDTSAEHDRENFAALVALWQIPGDGPKFSSPWTPAITAEAAEEREAIQADNLPESRAETTPRDRRNQCH